MTDQQSAAGYYCAICASYIAPENWSNHYHAKPLVDISMRPSREVSELRAEIKELKELLKERP